MALRVTYICVVLFQAGLFYAAQLRIKAKNDTTPIKWERVLDLAENLLTSW